MSDRTEPIEDLTDEVDADRLRTCTELLVDAARRLMRAELAAGEHPLDAIVRGTSMLEDFVSAMSGTGCQSAQRYAKEIEAALAPAVFRVGAERVWEWLLRPNTGLGGRTPLQELAKHGVRGVESLVEQLEVVPGPSDGESFEHTTTLPPPGYPTLTLESYHRIQEELACLGPVEMLSGVVTIAGEPLIFSPSVQRRAAALGIRLWGALDSVLAEPALRAEAAAVLGIGHGQRPSRDPSRG